MNEGKILIVDDVKSVRTTLKRFIGTFCKLEIIEAANGAAAMAALLEHGDSIKLAFCDYNMPESNGGDFLLRARRENRFSTLPIVFVSVELELMNTLLKQGANAFIEKPTTITALQEVICQYITPAKIAS